MQVTGVKTALWGVEDSRQEKKGIWEKHTYALFEATGGQRATPTKVLACCAPKWIRAPKSESW